MLKNQNDSSQRIVRQVQKSFDLWAKNYDKGLSNFFFEINNNKTIDFIGYRDNKLKILDVGCGTGNLLINLHNKNPNIKLIGIDISKEMIRVAKSKTEKLKNINFEMGDANNLPFENEYFDYVVCSNSLHHHPHALTSIKEMTRVLKKNGRLIIVDGFTNCCLRKIYFWIIRKIQGEEDVHRFSKIEMLNLFKQFDYKNIVHKNVALVNLLTIGDKL